MVDLPDPPPASAALPAALTPLNIPHPSFIRGLSHPLSFIAFRGIASLTVEIYNWGSSGDFQRLFPFTGQASARETVVGAVKNGQGVDGLRRALVLAGKR